MKKLKVLVLAVLAMASTGAIAQNGWWLEGNLLFDYQKETDVQTTSTFGLEVGVNYNLNQNWSVGLNIGDEFWKKDIDGSIKNIDKGNLFMITPHATYATHLYKRLYWTPRVNLGFGFGTLTGEYGSSKVDEDLTLINFGIQPLSFEYKISQKCALGATLTFADLYFQYNKVEDAKTTSIRLPLSKYNNHIISNNASDDLYFGNIGINFSFHYYL